MDDLESRISDEAKRLDRLHPLDAKHVVDSIESELRSIEENIQSLFQVFILSSLVINWLYQFKNKTSGAYLQ